MLTSNNLMLRSNVVELEASVQWRQFKPTQKAEIINALKPLRDANLMLRANIQVLTFGMDPETFWYAHRICDLLSECGFNPEYVPSLSADDGKTYGLYFLTKKGSPDPPFAEHIVKAFKLAKIECDWFENEHGNEGVLKILVYTKKPK